MRIVKSVVMALPALMLTVGQVGSVLTVSGVLSAPVYAADKKGEKQVSAKVGKPLKEALELAQAKKFKDAMAKVQEAQAISGKTPYEEYKINEIVAYVAINLQDYATATKAYEATLDSGELNAAEMKQRLDQLTKIYYQAKNYPKAIQFGNRYLKDVGSDTEIALLVAQAYYLQKDYPHTIEATESLLKIANQSGQPIKEEWLKLLMSSQHEANRDTDAMATLEQLLAKYPSAAYWRDIFVYLQNEGGSSDRKSMEMYRLKSMTGVLRDSEYVEMAQLAMALGFPGDAKNILEKGFNNKVLGTGATKDRENRLMTLAQTNSATDQKGLPTFEKEAIAAAGGDADIKLGEAYASYGQYDKAIEAMKRGLKKGNLKAEDEAHLQLGVAYLGAKRNSDAVSEFKAVSADSKLAHLARLWVIYAQNNKG
ncbi:MAG TPA: tetratricopeptide repeat protein [Spongiibacteraceae bacterium]|nr:tetratricopeptide repeat protein [Spongiibacteraceae bacterium]